MDRSLFETVVVPVASEDDADATCEAAIPYLSDRGSRIIVVHVIEKAGGYMDKAPLEQRQEQADRIFDSVERRFADADLTVETQLRHDTDVIEGILEAADDADATAIVFTPREASRWAELLAGDPMYKLVTESDRPVLALPAHEEGT